MRLIGHMLIYVHIHIYTQSFRLIRRHIGHLQMGPGLNIGTGDNIFAARGFLLPKDVLSLLVASFAYAPLPASMAPRRCRN